MEAYFMVAELKCSYSTIDPDELMAKVIPDYSIDTPIKCVFWERGANDTYQVRCTDALYFLRIYRHSAFPREANEFEAEALNYLHQQGCPVAYPIERKSGGFVTEILAPEGLRYALLTALAEGSTPDYDSPKICRLVGQSVARMHLASSGFSTSHKRTYLDLPGLLENSMVDIRNHLAHRQDVLSAIEKIAHDVQIAVQGVPEGSLDIGICHGDLHGGNLHVHDGKVTLFDFEECAIGYRVYDLATFKWGECLGSDERRAKRWPSFLEGYESIRPITGPERSLVDSFVIIRELAETAYGIRHILDFGYNGIKASDIDYVCFRLNKMLDSSN